MFNCANYALVFNNAEQTKVLMCRFEREVHFLDPGDVYHNSPTASTELDVPMCLLAPEELDGLPEDGEVGSQTILFVEYEIADFTGRFLGNRFVEIEVGCDEDLPASEFVRLYVEGGDVQFVAHELFTVCLARLFQNEGGVSQLH